MKYTYATEYIKREGYTTYSMVIGDGYGNKRTPLSKKYKTEDGVVQEVKVEVGDVFIAVRNRWEMVRERADILLYGVEDIVDGEPVLTLFDKFDGKYWDNKKHADYKDLIDLALERVGRIALFKKYTVIGGLV